MKGFNIAPPPAQTGSQTLLPVSELMQTLTDANPDADYSATLSGLFPGITQRKQQLHQHSSSQSSFGDSHHMISKLGKLAPRFNNNKRNGSHKRKWGTLIEAAKSGSARFIGRSRSEDSVCNTPTNTQIESISQCNSPGSEDGATDTQTDSNPSIDQPDDSNSNGGGVVDQTTKTTTNPTNQKEHHHYYHGSIEFHF